MKANQSLMPAKKRSRTSDRLLHIAIWASAIITIAFLAWILIYILVQGVPHISWDFLTHTYENGHGILSMIVSTLYVILLSLLFAVPFGVFGAIYLNEYAKPGKLVNCIRFATDSLAGIPSILFGLFGYIFFVQALGLKYSILSGSLTLAILVLPTIIRSTEESLKTVPREYKEGSLALGATKLYTLFHIVIPSALPGIVSAIILAMGRIVGETAAVFLTAGMVYRMPGSIMDSGRTLAVHLYALANEGYSYDESFATAAVLVILIAVINFAARFIAKKLGKRASGN